MGRMIIKDKIAALRKGHPTVSDKYHVMGAIVAEGSEPVITGELVKYSKITGYYEPAVDLTDVNEIAGIALATNVKLPRTWPADEADEVDYIAGEAFNLFIEGFIAVELDDSVITTTQDAVAAKGKKTDDTEIIPGKDYYTRTSNSDGAGYLNDGTYKYTLVDEPAVANIDNYYELSEIGQDAQENEITPNKGAAIILETGKLTTVDNVATGSIVALPGYTFTGFVDGRLAELRVK